MRHLGRILLASVITAILLGLGHTASAQDASLCEAADVAGPGAVIDGYTVVFTTGGSGQEIVLGYGGAYLSGGSGHDVLCAWGGGNTLDGSSGNDVLIVMDGTGNTLIGASGNDTLIGYVGDVFNGGSGRNEIIQNTVPTPTPPPPTPVPAMLFLEPQFFLAPAGMDMYLTVRGTGLQPGSSVTFDVEYKNGGSESIDLGYADTSGTFFSKGIKHTCALTLVTAQGTASDGSPISATHSISCGL